MGVVAKGDLLTLRTGLFIMRLVIGMISVTGKVAQKITG